jgi:hypothetical protein
MDSLALRSTRGPEDSHAALREALDWYARLPPGQHAPAFPPAVAAHLRDALAAPGRWEPIFFEVLLELVRVVRAMAPARPDVPACNVGDLLTAIGSLTPAAAAPWTWDPTVDDQVLAKLEVRETSAGIVQNHHANREGWWAHAERNRAFVRDAARSCARRESAVLLGAGQAFDLPLRELVETFERVRIVDIDGAALEATMRGLSLEPDLRRRVDLEVADLTGMNRRLLAGVDGIVAGAADADEARARLAALCRSYSLGAGPRLLADGARADLVVSSCLLSQIAWSQSRYARNVYERRFGGLAPADAAVWLLPWHELEARVQQDHMNALPTFGDVAVLTSDMAFRPTVTDGGGHEHATGVRTFLLSVTTLRDRVPCFVDTTAYASWEWNLLRPSGRHAGRRYDVEALVLRRGAAAPAAIG